MGRGVFDPEYRRGIYRRGSQGGNLNYGVVMLLSIDKDGNIHGSEITITDTTAVAIDTAVSAFNTIAVVTDTAATVTDSSASITDTSVVPFFF